jgi:tetratricopeptide (TPR) repeat protein
MIERNLLRLTSDEQRVLEAASVAGAEFSAATVAAGLQRPIAEIEASCTRLVRREQFLTRQGPTNWPDGTTTATFRFHHALYQEILYASLTDGYRVELHRRVAARVEEAYGAQASEIAAEMADHFQRANEPDKALAYFELAGERALKRCAYREGERHYRNALEVLLSRPESVERDRAELRFQVALGGISTATHGYGADDTLAVYARAKSVADRIGSAESTNLYYGLWITTLTRGEVRAALTLADHMLDIAQAVGPAALVDAYFATGSSHYVSGNLSEAHKLFERGVDLYRLEDFHDVPHDPGIYCICYSGIVEWLLGYPQRARDRIDEGRALARRAGKPFVLAHVYTFSLADVFRGDFADTSMACKEAEKLSTEAGFPLYRVSSRIFGAWSRAHLNGPGESAVTTQSLRADLELWDQSLFREMLLATLGETEDLMNATDEALLSVEQALQCTPQELWYRPLTLTLRGQLRLRKDANSVELAERDFRHAIELSREMSAKSPELRATTSLARLLRDTGRRDEARTMLAEIYGWFTEGFDTKDLKEAKALLDELSTPASSQPQQPQN